MIIRHRDYDNDSKKVTTKTMTVGDFINEVVLTDLSKEFKYYKVALKEEYNGKNNLVIYYQDYMVKSHHSTGWEFDYKEVVNYEIRTSYCERLIRAEDIISMKLDFEPKRKDKGHKRLPKEQRERVTESLLKDWDKSALEKSNRKNVFNDNAGQKEIINCVQQLVKDLEERDNEIYTNKCDIDRLKEREETLQEQIKWLEYRLDRIDKRK